MRKWKAPSPTAERVAELERENARLQGMWSPAEVLQVERDGARAFAESLEHERDDMMAERDAAQREVARLRGALESLFNGTRNYEARGMGETLPVDYEMPPSTAKRVRKLIADALARSEEKADE